MTNHTLFQFFEWNVPNDGAHWKRLKEQAEHLAKMGISAVWIPPATKAIGQNDVGYGIYDLYDFGEFQQKGTLRTKYGTKKELMNAISQLHDKGIQVYLDIVLNHKAGADETERFMAQEVAMDNREEILTEPYEIEAWTKFNFPGRGDMYSDFKWNWTHFTGTDYNVKKEKASIYKIVGENKDWGDEVDDEFGNYDYLMFTDIDYKHPDVYNEVIKWGIWVVDELNIDGFRLDAIKHINHWFVRDFLKHVREGTKKQELYAVGEYWKSSIEVLQQQLENVDYELDLFDVPLHYNFYEASIAGKDYDLRKIFKGTLVEFNPIHSVTFVDNHDSQPGQSLESWVEDWFKPLAYGLILLRKDGYPCVFYGDYYGISGEDAVEGKKELLDKLLYLRKFYTYGEQVDYLDHSNIIGWVRLGEEEFSNSGAAIIITNGEEGEKIMSVGAHRAGEKWIDFLGHREETVTIDEEGNGCFTVNGGSISVWVKADAN